MSVATAEDEYKALRRALCKRGKHVWGRGRYREKCKYCDAVIFPIKESCNADA